MDRLRWLSTLLGLPGCISPALQGGVFCVRDCTRRLGFNLCQRLEWTLNHKSRLCAQIPRRHVIKDESNGFHFGAIVAGDSRYEQALERRASIMKQLQELQAELRSLDEFVALYARLFNSEKMQEGTTAPKKRARNVLPPARLADICREVLLENGHPMTRTELLYALELRGIPLVGVDPTKNLGTILWRFKEKFVHIEGRGYWPAGVQL